MAKEPRCDVGICKEAPAWKVFFPSGRVIFVCLDHGPRGKNPIHITTKMRVKKIDGLLDRNAL